MEWLLWFFVALCSFGVLLGIAQLFWILRSPHSLSKPDETWPLISVLKPLKGIDIGLQHNLETLFTQDYPRYELLFGVEGAHDPVISLVNNIASRYPNVLYRMIIHEGGRGLNPKVSNLRAIWETGVQDIVIINDSNIAVGPHYLQEMVRPFLDRPKVGLVSSLFSGTSEETFWSFLENMYINGPLANMLASYQALTQEALVVGKSNAFRSSILDALGGFESLAYLLAEDYHMGKMMHRAGYEVVFSTQSCANRNLQTTAMGLWQRYIRWGVARSRLTPLLYPLESLLNPLLLSCFVWFWLGQGWIFAWYLGLTICRDSFQWAKLRGKEKIGWVMLCGPLRDGLYTLVWLAAPFYQTISWRGHRLHVGAGTHLFFTRSSPTQETSTETATKRV